RQARWTPLYDARLDTGSRDRKPSLELVRRAEITQSTGEDWSNVTLGVSTMRTTRGGDAPDLNPILVQYPQPPQPPRPQAMGRAVSEDAVRALRFSPQSSALAAPEPAALPGQFAKRADEQQAVAEIGAFQASFRIPGRVSIGASEGAKSLRIASTTITPDLVIRSTPVVDPTAFLQASFVQGEDAPLLPGKVSIYRDGI